MGMDVLLVDDSATVRSVIAKTLRIAGLEVDNVYQAGNGEEGLALLARCPVDLVFLDVNMPVMNGLEMVDRMSRDPLLSCLPVVVVSTEGSASRLRDLYARGVRACVRKPFSPEKLRSIVDAVLDQSDLRHMTDLAAVFCRILEQLAFVFAEPVSKDQLPPVASDLLKVEMRVTGQMDAELVLAIPAELCAHIAANILGLDASDPEAVGLAADALKEVASVTCSHMLTTRVGYDAVFDLSPGKLEEMDSVDWEDLLADPLSVTFVVDDSPMLLRFSLETPSS